MVSHRNYPMSKLDKEKVLSEFSDAYKAANGKAPKVEESSGWFSVDGGKNMRLAKLAEWAEELGAGKAKTSAKPAAKAAPKATSKAKPAVKAKPAAKAAPTASVEAVAKIIKSAGGLSAKELWQQHLEQAQDK